MKKLDRVTIHAKRIVDDMGRMLTLSAVGAAVFIAIKVSHSCEGTSTWALMPLAIFLLIALIWLFVLVVLGALRPIIDRIGARHKVRNKWAITKEKIAVLVIAVLYLGCSKVFFSSIEVALGEVDDAKLCQVMYGKQIERRTVK